MPSARVTSATGAPASTCRKAVASCSSENRLVFIARPPEVRGLQGSRFLQFSLAQFFGRTSLKHIYSVAERRGLVQSNPAKRVPLPDPHNERDRILSHDEWDRLYQASPAHLKPILLFAYRLGPRLGEILNLTWDRVDLGRGFIKLRSVDTKTKEPRLVPLTLDVH